LALASKVALIIRVAELPLLSGALECVRAGMIPGGLKANRDFAECVVEYAETVPDELRTILFDPQTAGGLLIAVAATEADELVDQLRGCQLDARRIGEVLPARKPLISVV
jgi:selenide,water dikinase